ncbi:helicase associated domain-containing protein [Streptomyces sp. NPDC056721]|uniref:helicase associated domain-containing protein n=1 Tax=Streptomyces sp. NPDC056721 TaxID=3345923 RepID=UPI0036CAE6D0
MVWSPADELFQENLEAARAYGDQHRTLCAPRTATMLDRPIGPWLSYLRRSGALNDKPEWETALREVDPARNPARPANWQRHCAALRELVADEEGQAGGGPARLHRARDGHREVAGPATQAKGLASPDSAIPRAVLRCRRAWANTKIRRVRLTAGKLQQLAGLGLTWAADGRDAS